MTQLNIIDRCPNSLQPPTEVTEVPDIKKDEWGFEWGTRGKGPCGECGRIIGLNVLGNLSNHSRVDPAARRKAASREREIAGERAI